MTPDQLMEAAGKAFLGAIENNLDTEDNLSDVRTDFDVAMKAVVGDKIITRAEAAWLASEYAWGRLQRTAGRATQRVLGDLAEGRVPLFDVEKVLDTPITVGENRRTTIRHLRKVDVDRAVEAREQNHAKMSAALGQFKEWAAVVKGWLEDHGDMATALAAGAIPTQEAVPEAVGDE